MNIVSARFPFGAIAFGCAKKRVRVLALFSRAEFFSAKRLLREMLTEYF